MTTTRAPQAAGPPADPAHAGPDGDLHGPSRSVPRLPRVYVPRARLWQRLDQATQSPLTLLVAPVGAGKTLGVSGWLRRTGRSEDAVWIHADHAWTPERMLAQIDGRAPDAAEDTLPKLIVVDDAHALPPATLRTLDTLLNEDPQRLRMLLLSRWDLPLTRLVPELLGNFTVLRGELLRMDPAESASLVIEHARSDHPDVLRAVFDRTQGWCAAIVLTARAIATSPDPVDAARRYLSGTASAADRVATEVFAALQPRERHLLLCLAGEEIVTTSTASHLSHDVGADEVLAGLETTGLLVTRVPEQQSPDGAELDAGDAEIRYRIHPLLTEVTRRRLVAGGVDVSRARATVVRAVRLDLARGETTRAFTRLVAVNEPDEAARVLADEGLGMVMRGRGSMIADFVSRFPATVEANPGVWFPLAAERWFDNDVATAVHWMDRILADGDEDEATSGRLACARLMRARLGLEPMFAAVGHARRVVLVSHSGTNALPELPLLLTELAITQNWLGDLAEAEVNLTTTIGLCRTRNLPAMAILAMTHLAFTEYMQGRERACREVAVEALDLLSGDISWHAHHAPTRGRLAVQLATWCDLPWATSGSVEPTAGLGSVHPADLCTRFWLRMRDARLALLTGSVSDAQRLVEAPMDLPPLPDHLHVVVLLERAFLGALSGDQKALTSVQGDLGALGALGEAALVHGLHDDLMGDRRSAAAHFATAAADVSFSQPATRALALTCEGQLRDALGDRATALDCLREAALVTEVRRNAVPFLGWSRQGTPVEGLLAHLDHVAPTPWVHELCQATAGHPGIATIYAPTTATPRELLTSIEPVVRPTLSPREREVLNELARGATYADIAANLFVSENTIKTHVSSLYGKLSVSRRSEALAVARNLHLL